jgi:CRP-like cAMP-binding protein
VASIAPAGSGENRLFSVLTRRDRKRVHDRAEAVTLSFGDILCEPDRPYEHVYFPLTGFVSLVTDIAGHHPLEVGLIGNEGMLGATLALGVGTSPLRGVVQGEGSALRLPTRLFERELVESPALADTIRRYVYVLMAQLTQTTVCTCFHEIQPRLARWLLMTHDRAQADSFHLTHQLLADMLGVRRSAVTIAAGTLQSTGLISYTRGEITVVDRQGLEGMACECYRAVIDDYARQFPSPH